MKWTDWVVPILITLVAWTAMGLAFTVGRFTGIAESVQIIQQHKIDKK